MPIPVSRKLKYQAACVDEHGAPAKTETQKVCRNTELWASQGQRDVELLERGQQRVPKMIKGLESHVRKDWREWAAQCEKKAQR